MQSSSRALPSKTALAAFLAFSFVFAALAWGVFATHWLPAFDRAAVLFLWERRQPALTGLLAGISWVHESWHLLAAVLVAAAWLWRSGRRAWAATLAVAVPGAMVLNLLLKHAFQRVRPAFGEPLEAIATYSFPSGHTTAAAALYGWLCAWAWARTRSPAQRAAVASFALLMAGSVALSRVYLGVHHPSDVAASLTVGGAWLALVLGALRPAQWPHRKDAP